MSITKEEMGNLKRTISHLQIGQVFANIKYKNKTSVTKNNYVEQSTDYSMQK